jgi:hypothetical protein
MALSSKDVTTVAHRRLRLVIPAIDVAARRAGDAIDMRWSVRRVARHAARMRGDRVQRRQLGSLVAARARRRCGDPSGAVRTVARGTSAFDVLVIAPFLAHMARRARRRVSPCTGMRLVTTHARLVTGRCARLLGRMARAARGRGSLAMNVVSVARRAVAMAWVRVRELYLGRVAGRTERRLRRRVEVVRSMTRRAGRVAMGGRVGRRDVPMARRARRGEGRGGCGGVRVVTGDAHVPRAVLHGDLRVAAFAGLGRGRAHVRLVRSVAGRALRMLGLARREGRLVAVAPDAGRPRRGEEFVRLVTAFARRVARRRRVPRLFVASRAGRDGGGRRCVRLMTIRARLAPDVRRVLGRPLRMAGRAVGDDRRLMSDVAARARDRRMVRNLGHAVSWLRVAADAGRSLLRRGEGMAGQATLRVSSLAAVTARDLLRVTGLATPWPRVFEAVAGKVVTTAALDVSLVHMGHVTLARPELCP